MDVLREAPGFMIFIFHLQQSFGSIPKETLSLFYTSTEL